MSEQGYAKDTFVILATNPTEVTQALQQTDLVLGLGGYEGSLPVANRVEDFIRVFNTSRNEWEFQLHSVRYPNPTPAVVKATV
jgi:hypothetical protein